MLALLGAYLAGVATVIAFLEFTVPADRGDEG